MRTILRWRPWPRKVRTRLALLYAVLFLVSGSALLGLTYGLVAANLPAASATPAVSQDQNQLAKLSAACKQPHPDPGTVRPASRPSARAPRTRPRSCASAPWPACCCTPWSDWG